MSLNRLITAALSHYRGSSLSIAAGVAVATAVITGALLVGDSMRGSLRALTVERLGRTAAILSPGRFFRPDGIVPSDVDSTPLMFFPAGIVETTTVEGKLRRAGSIQIIGIDDGFWDFDQSGLSVASLTDDDSVILNETAAGDLGVTVGDEVTLRLPIEQAVPADSPLGRRETQTEGLPRMRVAAVIPDRGLGRFSIAPNQASPGNVFLRRGVIAETLDRDGDANLLLMAETVPSREFNLSIESYGLTLKRVTRTFGDERSRPIIDYLSVTSDQLLLPDGTADAAGDAFPGRTITPALTYLANAIERIDEDGGVAATVPYSVITAIDSSDALPLDFEPPSGTSLDGRVPLVVNDWTADRLGVGIGDPLRLAYFEPEVENGNEIERYFDALVTGIVPITEPSRPYRRRREAVFDKPPSVYNDPDLTPVVPGVTDQDSIGDWDLPFPLKRDISRADDQYWNNFRLTPKAFLPLSDGQRLFGSRFGDLTGLRIAPESRADVPDSVRQRFAAALRDRADRLGFAPRPIRAQQLAASSGTTPFDGLFLALSFFVILAAVLLIAMLLRLGLATRVRQLGTLMAVGWTPARVRRVTLAEFSVVAVGGAVVGVIGGIVYAMAILWALRTYWVGAVTVPFLEFYASPRSLVIGGLAGWVVALVTILVSARSMLKMDAARLLAGQTEPSPTKARTARRSSWARSLAVAVGLVALATTAAGAGLSGPAAAGAFVGGGMLLLVAALLTVHRWLVGGRIAAASGGLSAMAAASASRHPIRSTTTIGLMAVASFLIVAITAFRMQPTQAGTGGFDLLARTASPVFRDLSDPAVRGDLLGTDADVIDDALIEPLRIRGGQDASCNNLYQATRPTVLAVRPGINDRFAKDDLTGFRFVGGAQPAWSDLETPAAGTPSDPVPVVIDQNTAMWSLQMTGGVGEVRGFEMDDNRDIYFRVVGLLENSVLQGRLIVGESNFERLFPAVSGYGFFLIAAGKTPPDEVAGILEDRLGDNGFDVASAPAVLANLMAVQNTYLRTFQSLGWLGLLLGTVGLAVSQTRDVISRRRELATLRAVGFTRGRISRLVMGETATLLFLGVGCGLACAAVAVVPHAISSGVRPPVLESLIALGVIIAFGLAAGLLATTRVTRMPMLDSLRAE